MNSLRGRYILEIALAIMLSLVAFGVVVLAALALHFDLQASAEGVNLARTAATSLPPPTLGMQLPGLAHEVQEWTVATGGRITIYDRAGHLLMTVPRPRPAGWPRPSLRPGIQLGRVPIVRSVVRMRDRIVAAEIPVSGDLDVLRDMALSLLAALALSILLARTLARRLIARVLLPVDRMARRAREMQRSGEVVPFPGTSGGPDEFSRLAGVLTDLTRDLEARRLRDRHLLAEAAHELRTPLEVMRGNLGLLRPESDAPLEERMKSFASIDRAINRLSRLSEDILMLERVARPSPPERLDVGHVLEEVAEDAVAAYPSRTITVSPPPAGLCVDADAQKLQRILWVLVENADRYTPPEGEIHLEAGRTAGGAVRISVIDEGPGIPPEEIGRVFERFFRGRGARSTEGTGLGLAIAHASAASMSGTLTLANRPGGGVEATLVLPASSSS